MEYSKALEIATELLEWVRDCCTRIEIVGGLKRHDKEEVHDIEFLIISNGVVPWFEPAGQQYATMLESRLAQLQDKGILRQAKNKANGDRLKRFAIVEHSTDDEDFCLELYIVRPEAWGIQNVIRTGPSGFSHRFVTNQAALGLLPDKYSYIKGETKIIIRSSGITLSLPEEEDAISLLELGWIPPNKRGKFA